MRKLNKTDNIIFIIFILFIIITYIFRYIDYKETNKEDFKNYSDIYFKISIMSAVITGIFMLWFLIRTGIDLSKPSISDTNIYGIKTIQPGFKPF